ncbi:hypothetical protein GCM10011581_12950 [Saccharopolyspora subtropica]|uniref:DUF2339 domain-containing protein n=1 Tax=Saccharopolyspora thermophila TaxID=89367 RepID=A0A917N8S5_9PSEU|nr:DUF2339 domain-containing protein [Saccharopolyspora subtropica]GGI77285.1 hypothetical protein GCM10011581_12950 [Saccharopolyspora subtropica]
MSQPQPGETLQWIAGELSAIGQRLTYLGSMVQAVAQESQRPHPAQQLVPPQPAPQQPEQPPMHVPPVPDVPAAQPNPGLEPSRVLAWVGAGVTLLGVVFLLILAAQQDWLGPAARVAGGAVLATLLVAAGWWLRRRSAGRIAAFALATTGFGALFLDVVAATARYGYLSVTAGLVVGLLVAVAGLALADWWRAQPLAIGVVLAAALCSPLITRQPAALLLGFLVSLQVAATPVQIRRSWRGLVPAAGIPVVLAALAASLWAWRMSDPGLVAAIMVAAVLGVLIAAVTARAGADVTAIGLLVAAPTPAFLAGPLVLERPAAGTIGGTLAVLLLAAWALGRFVPAVRLPARFVGAAGGMGAVAVVHTTLTIVDSPSWGTALLVEALLLGVGGYLLRSAGVLIGATCYAAAGFLLALVNEVPLTALLWYDDGTGVPGLLTGLLIAVVAVALPTAAVRIGRLPGLLPLWSLAGLALLYGTASATMAACLLVHDARAGFRTGHILITLLWVVAAIALLLRGVQVIHLRIAGMVLIAVSLAKLVLFDLATLDGFGRVVAFLCAGLILLAAGAGYARLLGRA